MLRTQVGPICQKEGFAKGFKAMALFLDTAGGIKWSSFEDENYVSEIEADGK